jgi:NADH-ubiquinone oxidoreductase chain 2
MTFDIPRREKIINKREMLSIGLICLLIAVPLFSYRITPSLFNRITSVILIYSALLAFNGLYIESLASGVGIYSGLFHVTSLSLGTESFLLFVGALILLGWAPFTQNKLSFGNVVFNSSRASNQNEPSSTMVPTISEYSLMILFTTIGASLLMSSSDLVSMYLSIELQSFAVYILATLYRESESSTAAGLKYFLLGGLSSALILLGTALIYSYTGLTQFERIYTLTAVTSSSGDTSTLPVVLGLVLIGVGFLFKVAAAPFHNWAPDVYDGVPTIVTSWLTTMPKISIFVFLLELQTGLEGSVESLSIIHSWLSTDGSDGSINVWKNLLLVTSLLSLVVGTVVGLSQYRIKRLLAFSTISHVGFLLLALAINTQESIESFLFYILQYSLTNVNTFLILLAFGYMIHGRILNGTLRSRGGKGSNISSRDIQFIDDLKGQFKQNPLLAISLALCLFSMAGIPPLIGFFAKQMVLYSSTHGGYYFLSIVAILVSVISASYYLKIIRVIYFEKLTNKDDQENTFNTTTSLQDESAAQSITNVHSMLIATLTMVITLFVLQPSILLNSCHLLALSLFYY